MKDKITRSGVDETKVEKNFYDSLLEINSKEIKRDLFTLQESLDEFSQITEKLKTAKIAYEVSKEYGIFPTKRKEVLIRLALYDENLNITDNLDDIYDNYSRFIGYSSSDIITEILFLINEL